MHTFSDSLFLMSWWNTLKEKMCQKLFKYEQLEDRKPLWNEMYRSISACFFPDI